MCLSFKYISNAISLRGARSIYKNMKKINNYLIILCIISYLIPFNWAINVGIGISDVTGPAAEIGMVRNDYIFCY